MLSKVSFFVLEHYWNNTSTTVWCYVDEMGWMDENSRKGSVNKQQIVILKEQNRVLGF